MIKAHYETYSSSGEICLAAAQTIVECRLPALEVAKVLTAEGTATLINATCENGEIRYSGKLLLTVLYEDAEGKICRAERGAEFFHKAEGQKIAPAHFAVGKATVENVGIRREGASVFLSALVLAEFTVYGRKETHYLYSGEGLAIKRETAEFIKTVPASVTFEEEDDFETEYAEGVLSHTEKAFVTSVVSGAQQIEVSGEVGLQLCILKRDGSLCSYERLIPFKTQVPADEITSLTPAEAEVQVCEAQITAQTDEEKGTAKIEIVLTLRADCKAYVKEEFSVCKDAYSPRSKVTLTMENAAGRYLTGEKIFTERIVCKPMISGEIPEGAKLRAVVSPAAFVTAVSVENGSAQVEGAVEAKLICEGENGGYSCYPFTMPFLTPAPMQGEILNAQAFVCGVGVRRKGGGEAEAEATLKILVKSYEEKTSAFVGGIEEGEEIPENDCAISVYLPKKGDDLWTTAKRLSQLPEEFEKCNEGLAFPLQGEERLLIYRQKGEN